MDDERTRTQSDGPRLPRGWSPHPSERMLITPLVAGLGGLLVGAISGKDYFVIQGIVLMLILALALSLFVVDLIYPLIDPRIRYAR